MCVNSVGMGMIQVVGGMEKQETEWTLDTKLGVSLAIAIARSRLNLATARMGWVLCRARDFDQKY